MHHSIIYLILILIVGFIIFKVGFSYGKNAEIVKNLKEEVNKKKQNPQVIDVACIEVANE